MGSTTRDSGTLISVTAVWGTGLWLSSYACHFEGHAHCASEQQTGEQKNPTNKPPAILFSVFTV